MKKKIFLLIIACNLIASCSKSNQNAHEINSKNTPPSWYINGKENTNDVIYGYGFGNTKESAEYVALSNLKERIFTSVSSKIIMQNITINDKTSNEYSHIIKTKMPNIVIPAHNISRIQSKKNEVFVEITVDKFKLADSILLDLNKSNDKISPLLKEFLLTRDSIKKIQLIKQLEEKCENYLDLERFYNGIGFALPNNSCLNIIKSYYNFKIENDLQIINTNPAIYEMFVNTFSKKMTISPKSQNIISYKTNIKTQKIDGSFIAGVEINIIQSNVSNVYKKNCTGSSMESKEKAVENAINNCLLESKNLLFEEFFKISK